MPNPRGTASCRSARRPGGGSAAAVDRAVPGVRRRSGVLAYVEMRQLARLPASRVTVKNSSTASQVRVPVADVAGIPSAVRADDLRQVGRSRGLRPAPGAVLEPARHAERPASSASARWPSIRRAVFAGAIPPTPAASRSALWPTNHARFATCPSAGRLAGTRRTPPVHRAVVAEQASGPSGGRGRRRRAQSSRRSCRRPRW